MMGELEPEHQADMDHAASVVRVLSDEIAQLKRQIAHERIFLWRAVRAAGGTIRVPASDIEDVTHGGVIEVSKDLSTRDILIEARLGETK